MGSKPQNQDYQLVQLAVEGNQNAFVALYQKYTQPIYRFCYWQTNDSQTAQDLTQDVFIQMAKSIKNFKNTGSFKNWLYTIAKRQVNHWIKQKYRLPQSPLFDNIIDDPEWIDPQNIKLKQQAVKTLLTKLTDKERQVISLRFLQEMTVKEVAAKLNLTAANVKVITHRSLKKLRKTFESVTPNTLYIDESN